MVLIYKLSAPTNAQKEQHESAWSSVYINSSLQKYHMKHGNDLLFFFVAFSHILTQVSWY